MLAELEYSMAIALGTVRGAKPAAWATRRVGSRSGSGTVRRRC